MLSETKSARHISELSADPLRPLTLDEIDHFDEYMTFKNDDVSAKDVSLTEAVDHIITNMDYYLGVPGAKEPDAAD
jgi:hypothetical protein